MNVLRYLSTAALLPIPPGETWPLSQAARNAPYRPVKKAGVTGFEAADEVVHAKLKGFGVRNGKNTLPSF